MYAREHAVVVVLPQHLVVQYSAPTAAHACAMPQLLI
jgi:hypothetical protein